MDRGAPAVVLRNAPKNSDWTLKRARPWALASDAWTPTPDGTLSAVGTVEVAFATRLDLPTSGTLPSTLLRLRDVDGALVAGRIERLTHTGSDAVVGLRFVPDQALHEGVRYTATLAGGSNGIRSADGRRMSEDYAWSFQANGGGRVYLPLVVR